MQKQRDTSPFRSVALAGCAAITLGWAGATAAQSPPLMAAPSDDQAESVDAPVDDAARLDALFAALAEAEAGPHERIVRDIRRIWSRSGSDTADLLLMRGQEALEKKDFTRAVHHLTALTEIAPDFPEGWNLRATAFYARGDIGLSLTDIERVLELEPRHFGALTGLGLILEQIGRDADALAAYRVAQALNPHLPDIDDAIGRLAPKVDGRDI